MTVWVPVCIGLVAAVALIEVTYRFQRWEREHYPRGLRTGEEYPFNEPAPMEPGNPCEDIQ